jgi:hypothetical protein
MASRCLITAEELRTLLSYDPKTGEFKRKTQIRSDGKVGCVCTRSGYVKIMVRNTNYLAHRIAWLYTTGNWPKDLIDHIDGDRSNNSIANLREATPLENQHNRRRANKNNTSGFMGVVYHERAKRFTSTISIRGKNKHLGYFNTKEDAHTAYLEAKFLHHPRFSGFGSKDGGS